ncbi:MAG: PIG-L deacetylase family protein [Planctomycetota bacterium]
MTSRPGEPQSTSLALPAPKLPRPCRAPPYRGRALVFSPHPDDESIGPGATLVLHARLGDETAAVFVTSGVHGDAGHTRDPAEYVALRRREAEAAAQQLGLKHTEFWGYPDSMVVTEGDLAAVAARCTDAILRLRPEVIYAPHPGEAHSDHHFVSLGVQRAVAAVAGQGLRPKLLGFEVWSPLDADLAVDVGAVYETKLAAVRCYASQMELNDIARAVDGLNRFRSVLLPPGGLWAEAFQELA